MKTEEAYKSKQLQIKAEDRAEILEKQLRDFKDSQIHRFEAEFSETRKDLKSKINQLHYNTDTQKDHEIQSLYEKLSSKHKFEDVADYQALVNQLEKSNDEIFTKDREIARLNKLLQVIKEERDKALLAKEQFRDINSRLLTDKDHFNPDINSKLQRIEENIDMLSTDLMGIKTTRHKTINFEDTRSRPSYTPTTLTYNPKPQKSRLNRINEVKSTLNKRFMSLTNLSNFTN